MIYDSKAPEGTGEGVYMKAKAEMLTSPDEIAKALAYLSIRKNQDPKKRSPNEFLGDYPRRVYKAIPEQVWINGDGEVGGNYIDIRMEVDLI